MRVAAAVVALCCAAALLPAPAGAHSLVRAAGPVVSYVSADVTSLNTVTVGVRGARIEFRDETVDGGMDPGGCAPGAVDGSGYILEARCPRRGVRRVRIDLGEREDRATLSLPIATTVLGGPGADAVSGGPAADELVGGDGNDLLDGGAGGDLLSGDQGSDTLTGGDGSDRVLSRDGESDTVTCGEGEDSVDGDTADRIAGDCESVARTPAPAPDTGLDDGRAPRLQVGAPTLQRLGRSRRVRIYATSSEAGAVGASGALMAGGLALPVQTIARKRIRVGGAGAMLTYELPGRHWRAARRALRRGRTVTVRLGVVATDLSGRTTRRDAPAIRLAAGPVLARGAHPEPGDYDGDGDRDELDNCPTVPNGGQVNTDRDLPGADPQGDACDDDDDADGVPDGTDNCRIAPNPGQEPHLDHPGYGAACTPVDTDRDGLVDEDDNCDYTRNADQSDVDGDDFGDLCDGDDDGDGLFDRRDNCPTVYDTEGADRDGDGIGTVCDPDESAVRGGAGRPPGLTLGVARRQRLAAVRSGVVVRVRCSEACGTTAELRVSRRVARQLGLLTTTILGSASAILEGRGRTFIFVRFDRRARRALFRSSRLHARLDVVAVDRAGNRRARSRPLTLLR